MSRVAGLAIVAVGLGVMLIAFAAAGGIGGGGGGQGEIVCDMVGAVSGKVHDDNVFKWISISSVNLSPQNCHERGIFEFNIGSPGALLSAGDVEITVRAEDIGGEVIGDTKFVVTTAAFQVEKDFVQNVKLKTLVKGDTYTIKVFAAAWENGQVKFTKQVTV